MEQFLVISSILLWLAILFNFFLTIMVVRRISTMSQPGQFKGDEMMGLKNGDPAPPFTAETVAGESITLSHFANRAVAFIFLSPSCQPCRDGIRSYLTLASEAIEAGVELVLVSTGEREETVELIKEFNINLPVLIAPEERNPFRKDYKITSTPSYYLLNNRSEIEAGGYPYPELAEDWKRLAQKWKKNKSSASLNQANLLSYKS